MTNFNHNDCFFFFPFASEMKLVSFSEKRLPPIIHVARAAEVQQKLKKRDKKSVCTTLR